MAFDIAFRIPNMFRSLFAEGAMTQALLPTYEGYKNKQDSREALKSLTSFILLILIIVSIAAWFMLPHLIPELMNDPAMKEPHTKTTIRLSQILFPYLIFISISAIYTAIQYSHGIFWSGAFGPVLINIVVLTLFGFYFFVPRGSVSEATEQDIYIFSYIILFSSISQFIFQSWILKKNQLYFGFSFVLSHPIIKNLFVLMLPAIFGAAVQHINLLVDIYLATSLKDKVPGAISALTYAQRLIQFPMGIFAVAVNTASMPVFSRQFAQQNKTHFAHSLMLSMRLSLFLMLPAGIGLMVYSEEVVSLVFERGRFDRDSTLITALALKYYAPGIVAYGIQKLLSSAFYAQHKTKTPAIIAGIILLFNVIFSLSLMPYLMHGGLALGSSLAAYMGVVIYLVLIHKKVSLKAPPMYYTNLLKLLLMNVLLFMGLSGLKKIAAFYSIRMDLSLLLGMTSAVFFYIVSSSFMKLEELTKIKALFSRRLERGV